MGFSCSAACGILVPQPGTEPTFPELEGGFLTPGPPGNPFSRFSADIHTPLKPLVSVKTCPFPDSVKSRDIILPTKVPIVKAMVFPVVMYGCGSWTIKKAEH